MKLTKEIAKEVAQDLATFMVQNGIAGNKQLEEIITLTSFVVIASMLKQVDKMIIDKSFQNN